MTKTANKFGGGKTARNFNVTSLYGKTAASFKPKLSPIANRHRNIDHFERNSSQISVKKRA